MQLKRGLGRGLESLIPPPIAPREEPEGQNSQKTVPIDKIIPNRLQPRTVFDEEKIRELAASIKEQGILQPLAVTPTNDGRYELIAGERRLRACRLAGLEDVPVIIKKVDDETLLSLSIIENVQREDLNPIEEARAYQELATQFNLTQGEIAKKVGKSRVAIANGIRLLSLPRVIQEDVACGRYSAGHARAILGIPTLHEQLKFREVMLKELPTVRDVEKMVQSIVGDVRKTPQAAPAKNEQSSEVADKLKLALGTKVEIKKKGAGGKLMIEYYSSQDLDRLYKKIIGV